MFLFLQANSQEKKMKDNKSLACAWLEAARPRTLPASISPVLLGCALAYYEGIFDIRPAILCFLVALFAQIASNFANDYFDFLKGADGEGRVGPKRSLATGEVSPKSMVAATAVALVIAALSGLSLLFITGKYWLLGAGIVIVLAALAYSGGPYPLSRHALGDVAVVLFFGLVSVCFTYYVQALVFDWGVLLLGLACIHGQNRFMLILSAWPSEQVLDKYRISYQQTIHISQEL